MTLEQLGGAITAVAAMLALLWWVFQVHRTAEDAKQGVERIDKERKEAVVIWGARLEKAESNAEATRLLAVNIENLSTRFATEIKHLTERTAEQTEFVREELKEVRDDLRSIKAGRVTQSRRDRTGD